MVSKRFIRSSSKGQSLVEFSLALPVLLLLVFGIIDFGLGIKSYISLTNAVREGARFGAVGNPAGTTLDCNGTSSTTIYGRVCYTANGLNLANLAPTVTYPNGQSPGESVVVTAAYRYDFVTPLGDFMSFFSGGSFPEFINLQASADMRLE